MPSREEQFDDWYANTTRNELLEAVTDKKRTSLEEDFLESDAYRNARDEFIIEELEADGEVEYFKEKFWYDTDREDDPEDTESDEESDTEEGVVD